MSLYTVDSSGQLWQIDVLPSGALQETKVTGGASSAGYTFSGSMVSGTAAAVIFSALQKLAQVDPQEAVDTADQTYCLEELQRIIDQWNARSEAIFSRTFQQYTLTPNHSPHTIGPGGDFNTGPAANYRPLRIGSASFILNSGTNNPVDSPIRLRDKQWWEALPLKSMPNSIVTDLYYDPAMPLGNLNFWPVCNISNPVRLELWSSLPQALTTNSLLAFSPGYWAATVLQLCRNCASAFGPQAIQIAATLEEQRREALAVIFNSNDPPPRIDLTGGMPESSNRGRPDFNFLDGLRR